MLNKIISIVADELYLNPLNLSANTSLDQDLDMDRVDRMALQIRLEDGFHIAIDTEKMCGFRSIDEIYRYIAAKRKRGSLGNV